MTKEYKINSTNVNPTDLDDCFLEPTDPIHALNASSIMGGLGASVRLAEYNELTQQKNTEQYFKNVEQAKSQGIRPGTPAWHAMFSR